MSTNDAYELIGGVLYETPIDETSGNITSQNFKNAQALADKILAITNVDDISTYKDLILTLDVNLINYINSRVIDFLIKFVKINSDFKTYFPTYSDTIAINAAAKTNDISVIKFLLERGSDHTRGSIIIAAEHGHLEIVKYLHESGVDINQDECNALTLATQNSHFDVVKYLVKHCNPIYLYRGLYYAVHNNRLDILNYLFDNGAIIDNMSYNMFDMACYRGNVEIVKCLHIHGYNIVNRYINAGTAAAAGHLDIVKYMVENGTDIHESHEYVLVWAATNNQLEVVKYLVEQCNADIHANNECALQQAARDGALRVVKYLIERGANIHAHRDWPIKSAARSGRLEVVKYLVESGADIRDMDNYAIRFAARYNKLDVVKYLYSCGADIHARNDYAMVYTIAYDSRDVIKWLVECGVDLQVNDNAGLKAAVRRGQISAVKYLMECNVDVYRYKDELLSMEKVFGETKMTRFLNKLFEVESK